MPHKNGGTSPPKVPPYVLEWVGRVVIATTSKGPQRGRVTSVTRKRVSDGMCTYAHAVIDDGPMWIGPVSELHVLSDRTDAHKELDSIA